MKGFDTVALCPCWSPDHFFYDKMPAKNKKIPAVFSAGIFEVGE
jgi:hypothetical protein